MSAIGAKSILQATGTILLLGSWFYGKITVEDRIKKLNQTEIEIYFSHIGLVISNTLRYLLDLDIYKKLGGSDQKSINKIKDHLYSQVKVYVLETYKAANKLRRLTKKPLFNLPSREDVQKVADNDEQYYALLDALVSETSENFGDVRKALTVRKEKWDKLCIFFYLAGTLCILFSFFFPC